MFLKTMKGTVGSVFGGVKRGVGKVLKIGLIVVGSQYAIAGLCAGANALAKNKNAFNKDVDVTTWLGNMLHGGSKEMKSRVLNDFANDIAHGGGGSSHDTVGTTDNAADVSANTTSVDDTVTNTMNVSAESTDTHTTDSNNIDEPVSDGNTDEPSYE